MNSIQDLRVRHRERSRRLKGPPLFFSFSFFLLYQNSVFVRIAKDDIFIVYVYVREKKEMDSVAYGDWFSHPKMGKDGAVVSSDVLVKICTALNCTMDDIVEIVHKN